MQTIPTKPTPNQVLNVALSAQACTIRIRQQFSGLYVDLYVNDTLIIAGVLCQNLNRIVRSKYLGFIGDLGFYDTQSVVQANGSVVGEDPDYTGLGSRFVLIYLTAEEAGQ